MSPQVNDWSLYIYIDYDSIYIMLLYRLYISQIMYLYLQSHVSNNVGLDPSPVVTKHT